MSLVGLLTLGSCTPPAKNNLSPSQVASPDIKNAPYLLKPSAQGSKMHSGLSPEIEARLRQKYGPFVKIGFDPEYWALLNAAQKNNFQNTPATPFSSDFRIQYERMSVEELQGQCTGSLTNNPNDPPDYYSIGDLRDLAGGSNGLFCDGDWPKELNLGGAEQVVSCYNAGGSPIYDVKHICDRSTHSETGSLCFEAKFQTFFYECYQSEDNGGGSSENDPNNGCDPKGQNCEADLPDFFLLAHHGNRPLNRAVAPGDSPTQQVTLSPEDVNDAFDWTRLTIRDNQSQGWQLQISNANGKLLKEESGTGSTFVEWDGSNPAGEKVANGIYTARLTSPALPGTQIERMIRIDNNPPLVSNIRVQENPSTGFFSVKAKLKEAGNGAFQSGINPDTIQIFFDYFSTDQGFGKSYDAATGEYSVQFSNLAQYQQAKQLSQQSGYDFPFELRVSDYAGNETSNRGSGPDGPLRIQVTDPYFSPNADGVKDSLNFKVIAETSEPYLVAIKRNGIAVKAWYGLTGEQNLSWDGNFIFTDNLQADGSYRIVAMTERQRDRVRDAQMVVLDTVGPVFTNSRIQKKNGGYRIQSAMSDKPAGIQPGTLSLAFQDAQGQAAEITGQLETENGVSPFVYNLQASAEQFNQLKTGDIQAKASVQDKAGNTANVNLNLGDAIFLQSARFLNSGDIEIKGTINANLTSVDISNIYPDFDGMLNFTDYQFNQDPQNKRRFTLIIPAGYTFSSQSENMIKSLSEE